MFYVIVQKKGNICLLLGTEVFKTLEGAEEARIYHQPDYDSLLEVKEII